LVESDARSGLPYRFCATFARQYLRGCEFALEAILYEIGNLRWHCITMEQVMKKLSLLIVSTVVLRIATLAWGADKVSEVLLRDAIQGNLAAIQMGQLAQERAQSPELKAFAATVMVDHWASNEQAEKAAKQIGITIPTEPSFSQKLNYEHMSKLSDKALDRAVVAEMIVFYKTIIPRFKNEAKKTNDPVGIFAHEELPRLQEHLDAAQKLQSRI
jgi:putative membrane protein